MAAAAVSEFTKIESRYASVPGPELKQLRLRTYVAVGYVSTTLGVLLFLTSAPGFFLMSSQEIPCSSQNTRIEFGRAAKRLQSELSSLMLESVPGVSAFPESDDILTWRGTIRGTEHSPYSGMRFHLALKFPQNYPFSPPTVTFVTRCFHPNIDYASGTICLDILKEHWSSTFTVKTILLSIQSLLDEPNVESPLNVQAAGLWETDPREFREVCIAKYEEATGEKIVSADYSQRNEGKSEQHARRVPAPLYKSNPMVANRVHRYRNQS